MTRVSVVIDRVVIDGSLIERSAVRDRRRFVDELTATLQHESWKVVGTGNSSAQATAEVELPGDPSAVVSSLARAIAEAVEAGQ